MVILWENIVITLIAGLLIIVLGVVILKLIINIVRK